MQISATETKQSMTLLARCTEALSVRLGVLLVGAGILYFGTNAELKTCISFDRAAAHLVICVKYEVPSPAPK